MARTKQTARFTTGGNAPRKTVASRGACRRKRRAVPVAEGSAIQYSRDDDVEHVQIETINYDVSYESCFYAHYFTSSNFGVVPEAGKTFVPKFSMFQTVQNPSLQLQNQEANWLNISFDSSYDGAGSSKQTRPSLNVVIALDVSGSMNDTFQEGTAKKIASAKACILSLTKQLRDTDYFGLIVFNNSAKVVQPSTKWSDIDPISLDKTVNKLKAGGGTRLDAGIEKACEVIRSAPEEDNRYSRIFFLTDMEANSPVEENEFILREQEFSRDAIYTTIIGVGMDLCRKSVVDTSTTPGCNYCNVRSDEDFRALMENEFAYLVAPIAFNVSIDIVNSSKWAFVAGYGSPEISDPQPHTAKLCSVFPTSLDEYKAARSGSFLFKIAPLTSGVENTTNQTVDTASSENTSTGQSITPFDDVVIKISWDDVQGICHHITQTIPFSSEVFDKQILPVSDPTPNTNGIRKAILLVRYTDYVKEFIKKYNAYAEFANEQAFGFGPPIKRKRSNTTSPESSAETESTTPTKPEIKEVENFIEYFELEKAMLCDDTLLGELNILNEIRNMVETMDSLSKDVECDVD